MFWVAIVCIALLGLCLEILLTRVFDFGALKIVDMITQSFKRKKNK